MGISRLKEQTQNPACCDSKQDSKYNRNRNIYKIHQMCLSALRHTAEGRKQHNHKNIITGSSRQNHLRNTFLCSIPLFHQLHHSRYHHRRRHCCQNRPHDCCFNPGNTQYIGRQQEKSKNFKRRRHAGHHNSRAAYFFQIR